MQTKPKLRINLMWKKYPSAFPNSFPQVHFSSFLNIRWKLYLTCWGENAFIPRLIVTLIGVIAGQMSTWVLGVTFFCVLCMGKDMTFWFTCIWPKKYYSNIEYISVYIYMYIYICHDMSFMCSSERKQILGGPKRTLPWIASTSSNVHRLGLVIYWKPFFPH